MRRFETPPITIDTRDGKSRALSIRFTIAGGALAAGSYDCQFTVLDPSTNLATFRRQGISVR